MSAVIIGAVLWDMFGETRHLGGAPFNVAAHAQRLGIPTAFISGVGNDALGHEIMQQAHALNLDTRYLKTTTDAPTGTVDVFFTDGQPDYTIKRPAAYDYPKLDSKDLHHLAATPIEWIYFGSVEQTSVQVRQVTQTLLDTFPTAHRFFDINLRQGTHTLELLEDLLQTTTILKVNEAEMTFLGRAFNLSSNISAASCHILATHFSLEYVCITRGAQGCVIWHQDHYIESPGYPIIVSDTVGAGDAFVAAFMYGMKKQWPVAQIADYANRLGALVASKTGAIPNWTPDEIAALDRF